MKKICLALTTQLIFSAADDQAPIHLFEVTQATEKITGIALSKSGAYAAYISEEKNRSCSFCQGSSCVFCQKTESSPFSSAPSPLARITARIELLSISNGAELSVHKQKLFQTEGTVLDSNALLTGTVAFSHDGKLLAAGSACKSHPSNGSIKIWSTDTKELRATITKGLSLEFNYKHYSDYLNVSSNGNAHICFDPSGKRIASTNNCLHHLTSGSCTFIHDIASGEILLSYYLPGAGDTGACTFNAEGDLYAAQLENRLLLWDVRMQSNTPIRDIRLENQSKEMLSISSANGLIYVSSQPANNPAVINIIDTSTGKIIDQIPMPDNGIIPVADCRPFEIVETRREARNAYTQFADDKNDKCITGLLSANKRILLYETKEKGLCVAIAQRPFLN